MAAVELVGSTSTSLGEGDALKKSTDFFGLNGNRIGAQKQGK